MSETINQRIKRIRKSKNMTQIEIAKKLGMKPDTYSKFERVGKIRCDMLLKIAEILETDVSAFLYNSSESANGLFIKDIHEKLIILAMRNLPYEEKLKLFEIIFDKFLNSDDLINSIFSGTK